MMRAQKAEYVLGGPPTGSQEGFVYEISFGGLERDQLVALLPLLADAVPGGSPDWLAHAYALLGMLGDGEAGWLDEQTSEGRFRLALQLGDIFSPDVWLFFESEALAETFQGVIDASGVCDDVEI
ncbi:hypothetical protein BH11ARM2_BH11ARM2_39670 [soil metagenome]